MAKSVRASVSKRNKAKLRATVFGPVVDARTERLSAKLQVLASQAKPSDQQRPESSAEATYMGRRLCPSVVQGLGRLTVLVDTQDGVAKSNPQGSVEGEHFRSL